MVTNQIGDSSWYWSGQGDPHTRPPWHADWFSSVSCFMHEPADQRAGQGAQTLPKMIVVRAHIYIYIAAPLHMLRTLLEICAFRLSKGMESSIFCSTSRRLRRSLVSASYFTASYCKCKWTNPSLLDLGATEPRFKDHHRHL